jgi:peptidoglycan/LPS O-acetylase OafA/YrhL
MPLSPVRTPDSARRARAQTDAAPTRRWPALDGVRGLAALGVLAFHVYHVTLPTLPHWRLQKPLLVFLISLGANGVSCFFVLSAFLVSMPFLRWLVGDAPRPDMRRYATQRVFRIFPAWWLALMLVSLLWAGWLVHRPVDLLAFLTLTQDYLGLGHRVLPQGWTLVVEISFYLVLPLAAAGAGLVLRGAGRLVRVGVLALGLSAAALASWGYQFGKLGPAPHSAATALSLPAYLDRFCLGAIAALLLIVAGRLLSVWAMLPLAAVPLWLALNDQSHYRYPLCAMAFALVVLGLAADTRAFPSRLLGSAPMVELGRLSYGVYLWHLPLLYMLERAGVIGSGGFAETAFALVVVTVLSVLAAELSYRVVERPALNLSARVSAAWARRAPVRPAVEIA